MMIELILFFGICLITAVIVALLGFTLYLLLCYSEDMNCISRKEDVKLKFSSFINYYKINPDKWNLKDSYVKYNMTDFKRGWYSEEYITCYFGLISWIKYKCWKINKKKQEEKKVNCKNQTKLLKSVQMDINEYKERHKIDIDEHIEIFTKAYNNMKNRVNK